MKKTLILLSFIFLIVGCSNSKKYKLTVDDPNNFIIEKMNKEYFSGEKVIVKTSILYDVDLKLFLDDEFVCSQTVINDNGTYTHWEFYFTMPAKNAKISFKTSYDKPIKEYSFGDIEMFSSGFNRPNGVTISPNGTMYVSNRSTNKISTVNADGEIHEFVTVPCKELLMIITDDEGIIYAAGTDKVFKITSENEITEIASDFGCADDLVFDDNGNLFVTDAKRNIVYKIAPDLTKSIFIDNNYDGILTTWFITGITFNKTYDSLYVVRMDKGEILKYPILEDGTAGNEEIIISGLIKPDHITCDDNNNLYVTLYSTGILIKITDDNNVETICDNTMSRPTGLVIGKGDYDSRFVYVADNRTNIIFRIYID